MNWILLISLSIALASNCGEYSKIQKTTSVKLLQCPDDISEVKLDSLFIPKSQGQCDIDSYQVFEDQGCLDQPGETYQFSQLWQYDDPDLPSWDDITFSPPGQIDKVYNPSSFTIKERCYDPDDTVSIGNTKWRCLLKRANIREDLEGVFQNHKYYLKLDEADFNNYYPNYNNQGSTNWTKSTTQTCDAQQAFELEWNHPIQITSIEFAQPDGNGERYKRRYIDHFRLSYLTDEYEWIVNSELTRTGLDGSQWSNEIFLAQPFVARGIRIDFVPRWNDGVPDLYMHCWTTVGIDMKFKKISREYKSLFAVMDLGASPIEYDSFAQDSNQFTGGQMNVQAGGWRTADADNEITTGSTSCSDTKVSITLKNSSIVDGIVFAKLKPVKIVKSLDINYGNKAIENHQATFTNINFNGGCTSESILNPGCSPSLIYNYTHPTIKSFFLEVISENGDSGKIAKVHFNCKNPPCNSLVDDQYFSVTRAYEVFTFANGYIQYESDQFSLQATSYELGVPMSDFLITFFMTTSDTTPQGLFSLYKDDGNIERHIYMVGGYLRVKFCGESDTEITGTTPQTLDDGFEHKIQLVCLSNLNCKLKVDDTQIFEHTVASNCFSDNIKKIKIGTADLPASLTTTPHFTGTMKQIQMNTLSNPAREITLHQRYQVKDIQWRMNKDDPSNFVKQYRLYFKHSDSASEQWKSYQQILGQNPIQSNLEGTNGQIIRTPLDNSEHVGSGPFIAKQIRFEYLDSTHRDSCNGFCVGQFDFAIEHFTEQGYIKNFKLKYLQDGIWKDYNNGQTLSTGLTDSDIYNKTGHVDLVPFQADKIEITILREPMTSLSASGIHYGTYQKCMTSGRFDIQVSSLAQVASNLTKTECLDQAVQSSNKYKFAVFQDSEFTSCSASITFPTVTSSHCDQLNNSAYIFPLTFSNIQVQSSSQNQDQKMLSFSHKKLNDKTLVFIKFKSSQDQQADQHGWSEKIEFIKHSQIAVGQPYMACKTSLANSNNLTCPNAVSSFTYTRFITNSISQDCSIIPTSTLTSAFDSQTQSLESLQISFLLCNSNGKLEKSQVFQIIGNFICIPQTLIKDNQNLKFWAHVQVESEFQVFLQYSVDSTPRSYNTLPSLIQGNQTLEVEIGSSPLAFEQTMIDYNNDLMSFTFQGTEAIEFATIEEFEQQDQFKRFTITVDASSLNESFVGVYSFDLQVYDSFETQAISFQIHVLSQTPVQMDESQDHSDIETQNDAQNDLPQSDLVQQSNFSSFQGFIITNDSKSEESLTQQTKKLPLTAKIKRTSFIGAIEINFNENLVPIELEKIDSSQLELFIVPQDGRDLQESFEKASLNFEWKATYQSDRQLVLQCYFENPKLISPGEPRDIMKIKFKEGVNSVFKPQGETHSGLQTKELSFKIKKQVQRSAVSDSVSTGAEMGNVTLLWCLIATFLMNIICADGGMDFIVQMIRTLQIAVHLGLVNINLPANVLMTNYNLIQIAMLDVLSSDGICEKCDAHQYFVETEAEQQDEIPIQIESLGYESFNRINNMGSISLFLVLYFFKIAFMLLLYVVQYLHFAKGFKKYIRQMQKFLIEGTFFNQILGVLLESYFEFLVAAYLHLNYTNDLKTIGLYPRNLQSRIERQFDELQDFNFQLSRKAQVATLFTYVTLILLLAIVPYLLIKVMFSDECFLECQAQPVYGALFEGIKTRDRNTLSFNFVFVMRRIVFVFTVMFLTENRVQLQLILALNLSMIIYNCSQQRVTSRVVHFQIVFNECCLMILHLNLCIFTEWTEPQIQDVFGWVQIAVQTLMICGNIPLIFYFGVQKFCVILKGLSVRLSYQKDKFFNTARFQSLEKSKIGGKLNLNLIIKYQTAKAIQGNSLRPRKKVSQVQVTSNTDKLNVNRRRDQFLAKMKDDLSIISEDQSNDNSLILKL